MHVLHLIDAGSAQATGTTLAMIADARGRLGEIEQTVALLGGAPLRKSARRAGVEDALLISTPYGAAPLGWIGLSRALRERGLDASSFDVVHCWSIGALSAAAMLWRRTPRLLTLTVAPTSGGVRWLRVLTGELVGTRAAPTVFLPISSTLKRQLLTGGVAESSVHVLRPAIDMGRVAHNSRAALREAWRIEDDSIRVIGILGDPPTAADATIGLRIAGLATEQMRDRGIVACPLVHPDQDQRRRAEQMVAPFGRYHRGIRSADLEWPWRVLPGCDAVVTFGPHGGGLSLLWAMAANVPIVGEATYAVSEIVEDRHSALLAMPGRLAQMAHRVTQLIDDPQLAWRLRDTARHEAYSFFSRKRYCQSLRDVYTQLAEGKTIEVPPMESTGGLRFAGRA